MREACTSLIYELCNLDENVMALTADSRNSIFENIKKNFPDQYLDYGISEQNMIASAAGLSDCGKIPFIFATSNFIAMRGYEFIRNDLCISNKNVKIIGVFCGLARGKWGATHQGTDEYSLLRGLPNIKVITPVSPIEAREATRFAYRYKGPVYIRLEASGEIEYFDDDYKYEPGNVNVLQKGKSICILCMGSIVSEAIEVARFYEERSISIGVLSIADLGDETKKAILEKLKDYDVVITLEEHNKCGGIGSFVAEILSESSMKKKFKMIGLTGCPFGCGDREYLRDLNGIGVNQLKNVIEKINTDI